MSRYISKSKKAEYAKLWRKVNSLGEKNTEEDSPDPCISKKEPPIPVIVSTEQDCIRFSSRIMNHLKGKMRDHNKNCSDKVSLSDLVKEYRFAAKAHSPDNGTTKNVHSLSCVNVFLDTLAGKTRLNYLERTKKEILDNNLDFDFNNIEDLYIENYEKLNSKWE